MAKMLVRLVGATLIGTLLSAPVLAQDSDSLTWARANSCESIRDYVARYPDGRHLAAAREQLRVRNCPDANRPLQTPTQRPSPAAQADPCQQARTDWPEVEQSASIAEVRAYRSSVPAACPLWRTRADERIMTLAREERERQEAEAQRLAEEAAVEQERQRVEAAVEAELAPLRARSQQLLPAFESLSPYGQFSVPWAALGRTCTPGQQLFRQQDGRIFDTYGFEQLLLEVAGTSVRVTRLDPLRDHVRRVVTHNGSIDLDAYLQGGMVFSFQGETITRSSGSYRERLRRCAN